MSRIEETLPNEEDTAKKVNDETNERFRIYSIVYYFLLVLFVGVPGWWFTTRVYRASLPLNEMYNLQVPSKTIRDNSIQLSLDYDVLITIVNPAPEALKLELSTEELIQSLEPVREAFGPIANLTLKSQWLYVMELGVSPKKVGDHYRIYEEQLPHMITPLEKKVWSHMSSRPTLNLVVYLSHCHVPLYMYNSKKYRVKSQAFLSPPWGGVQFYNPDPASCKNKTFKPDLKTITRIFKTQLKRLLGVNGSTAQHVLALKKSKAVDMMEAARRTLKCLAKLMSEISGIVISDDVAAKLLVALDNVKKAEAFMLAGNVDQALQCAQVAFGSSEAAFSDPSLLALLYFPEDQKYAVYIPLFLPIMIPVVMSLRTVNAWYQQNKKIKTD